MSRTLTVSLSDGLYQALERQAQTSGTTPAEVVEKILEQQVKTQGRVSRSPAEVEAARGRFQRHFGAVAGVVGNTDNESIDADLAREYADNHEDG